jgi:hypothetical protein
MKDMGDADTSGCVPESKDATGPGGRRLGQPAAPVSGPTGLSGSSSETAAGSGSSTETAAGSGSSSGSDSSGDAAECPCGFGYIPNTALARSKAKVWCENAADKGLLLAWDQNSTQTTDTPSYQQLLKDAMPAEYSNITLEEHPDVAGCKYLKIHYTAQMATMDYYLHLSRPSNYTKSVDEGLPLVYTGASSVPHATGVAECCQADYSGNLTGLPDTCKCVDDGMYQIIDAEIMQVEGWIKRALNQVRFQAVKDLVS